MPCPSVLRRPAWRPAFFALAKASRVLLDAAGMTDVRIMLSGGLDEQVIAALLADRALIDGFGVGTAVDVVADRPYLDAA